MLWRRWAVHVLCGAVLLAGATACSTDRGEPPLATGVPITAPADGSVLQLVPRVLRTLPHDTDAFTQGLEFEGDVLVESLGLYGESGIRRVDPESGDVLAHSDLDDDLFGEGLTRVDDRWLQLTWREGVVVIWDAELREVDRLEIPGQGWGLCFDGEVLHHSDGSAVLRQRDPDDLSELGSVTVTLDGEPLAKLNELECVDGSVWANVWLTNTIVQIDPATGAVTAIVDASTLAEQVKVGDPSQDVLNGIAHDPRTRTFWLTGKHWPTMFEVELIPEP